MAHIFTALRFSLLVYARHGAFWQLCLLLTYFFAFSGMMMYLESRDTGIADSENLYFLLVFPLISGVLVGTNMYGWLRRAFVLSVYVPNRTFFHIPTMIAFPCAVLFLSEAIVLLGFVLFSRTPLWQAWQANEIFFLLLMIVGSILTTLWSFVYFSLRQPAPLADSLMKTMFASAWNRENSMIFVLIFAAAVGASVPTVLYHTLAQEYTLLSIGISCLWLLCLSVVLARQVRTAKEHLYKERLTIYRLLFPKR